MSTFRKYLLIGVGIVVLLVFIGTLIGGDDDDADTNEVIEDTATASQVEVEPEGLPELSASECDYLEVTALWSSLMGDALVDIATLVEDPQISSSEWRRDMAIPLAVLVTVFDSVVALDPPESLAAVHAEYSYGTSALSLFADMTMRGIDELDIGLLTEALVQMQLGTQAIGRAADLVTEFSATRSGSCEW